jgi:peptide/nickel transport system substrate-binding protein
MTGPYPTTGPYIIASVSDTVLRLERNPVFHSWSPQARPDGYPDAIVFKFPVPVDEGAKMVAAGTADYLADQIPPAVFPSLRTQYTAQLHLAATSTTFVVMNVRHPPFERQDVRRAVALALDRDHLVALRGGAIAAATTCQLLPPNFRGYQPYCPHTRNPSPAGRWSAPDLDGARQLIAASGTAGMKIVVGPVPPRLTDVGAYLTGLLRDLGYDATQIVVTDGGQVFAAVNAGELQIGAFEYLPDYPSPETFLGSFTCALNDPLTSFCDPALDAKIAQAGDLEATDPAAAAAKWAEIDRAETDLALWAPVLNEGSDFVSARVGNYQFHIAYSMLLDQAWVQ